MSGGRMRRVDEAVREVLSGAITQELKDPRVGFVTVTAVETSPDLRHARVFVSVLGNEPQRERSMDRAALRARLPPAADLNEELTLKHTPTLDFLYDDSVDRSLRIQALLEEEDASERLQRLLAGAHADARRAAGRTALPARDAREPRRRRARLAGRHAARAGRARQGRRRLHGAGRVPAALRVPLHPDREPGHRAARRPRGAHDRLPRLRQHRPQPGRLAQARGRAHPQRRPPPRQHPVRDRQPGGAGGVVHGRGDLGPDRRTSGPS